MSSTNRGAIRNLDDHYATPPELADLICRALEQTFLPEPVNLLEPGCGEGFFLDAFKKVWPNAVRLGVELNPELEQMAVSRGHAVQAADLLEWVKTAPDWSGIITNPPFKDAEAWIDALLPRLDQNHGVLALLLRLNFLGGAGRYERLWKNNPPTAIWVMPARPGFTPDGLTDSIEYMVCIWTRTKVDQSPTEFDWLDNRGISNKWAGATLATRMHQRTRPRWRSEPVANKTPEAATAGIPVSEP